MLSPGAGAGTPTPDPATLPAWSAATVIALRVAEADSIKTTLADRLVS